MAMFVSQNVIGYQVTLIIYLYLQLKLACDCSLIHLCDIKVCEVIEYFNSLYVFNKVYDSYCSNSFDNSSSITLIFIIIYL